MCARMLASVIAAAVPARADCACTSRHKVEEDTAVKARKRTAARATRERDIVIRVEYASWDDAGDNGCWQDTRG